MMTSNILKASGQVSGNLIWEVRALQTDPKGTLKSKRGELEPLLGFTF
jgi:hypothetical protein